MAIRLHRPVGTHLVHVGGGSRSSLGSEAARRMPRRRALALSRSHPADQLRPTPSVGSGWSWHHNASRSDASQPARPPSSTWDRLPDRFAPADVAEVAVKCWHKPIHAGCNRFRPADVGEVARICWHKNPGSDGSAIERGVGSRRCQDSQARERSTARSHWACDASAAARSVAGSNSASRVHAAPTSSVDSHRPSASPARNAAPSAVVS